MPSNIANEPTPGFLAALSDCKKITVKSGQILFHGGRLGKWGNIEELHNNISYEWVSSDKYSARSYAYDKVTMPGLPFLLELELNTDVTAIVASQSQLFKFAQWTLESSNRFAPAEFTKAFTQHASKVVGNEKVIFINVIEMAQLSLNDVLVPFPGKQLKIRNKAILPLK